MHQIMIDSLVCWVSDPSAACGKIRLVKRASTNKLSDQTFHSGYAMCRKLNNHNKTNMRDSLSPRIAVRGGLLRGGIYIYVYVYICIYMYWICYHRGYSICYWICYTSLSAAVWPGAAKASRAGQTCKFIPKRICSSKSSLPQMCYTLRHQFHTKDLANRHVQKLDAHPINIAAQAEWKKCCPVPIL